MTGKAGYSVTSAIKTSSLDIPDTDLAVSARARQLLSHLVPSDGRDHIFLRRGLADGFRALFAMPQLVPQFAGQDIPCEDSAVLGPADGERICHRESRPHTVGRIPESFVAERLQALSSRAVHEAHCRVQRRDQIPFAILGRRHTRYTARGKHIHINLAAPQIVNSDSAVDTASKNLSAPDSNTRDSIARITQGHNRPVAPRFAIPDFDSAIETASTQNAILLAAESTRIDSARMPIEASQSLRCGDVPKKDCLVAANTSEARIIAADGKIEDFVAVGLV
jgi:hypothetical protein